MVIDKKPKLLLAEDYDDLREIYKQGLEAIGFEVSAVDDGDKLYELLKKKKFDVVLSDTDMPNLSGVMACRKAIEDKILDENTLVIGMSDDPDYQQYWRGIANLGCFYHKSNLNSREDVGNKIMRDYKNFKFGPAGWRMKMLRIQ